MMNEKWRIHLSFRSIIYIKGRDESLVAYPYLGLK